MGVYCVNVYKEMHRRWLDLSLGIRDNLLLNLHIFIFSSTFSAKGFGWCTWVARLVGWSTLDMGSSHDLGVLGSARCGLRAQQGICWAGDSLSPSAPPLT